MPTQNYAPYIEAPYSVMFVGPSGQYMTGDERTQVLLKSQAVSFLNLIGPVITSKTGGPLIKGPNPMAGVSLVLVQLDGTDQSGILPIWTPEKPASFNVGVQIEIAPIYDWVPLDPTELSGNGLTAGRRNWAVMYQNEWNEWITAIGCVATMLATQSVNGFGAPGAWRYQPEGTGGDAPYQTLAWVPA